MRNACPQQHDLHMQKGARAPRAPSRPNDSLRSFVRACLCVTVTDLRDFPCSLAARERAYALHNSIKLKCFAIPHRRNLLYNSQFFNCISGDKRRTRPNGTLRECIRTFKKVNRLRRIREQSRLAVKEWILKGQEPAFHIYGR